MIRIVLGFFIVFGSVGGMENSPDSDMLLLTVMSAIGLLLMYSGVESSKRLWLQLQWRSFVRPLGTGRTRHPTIPISSPLTSSGCMALFLRVSQHRLFGWWSKEYNSPLAIGLSRKWSPSDIIPESGIKVKKNDLGTRVPFCWNEAMQAQRKLYSICQTPYTKTFR